MLRLHIAVDTIVVLFKRDTLFIAIIIITIIISRLPLSRLPFIAIFTCLRFRFRPGCWSPWEVEERMRQLYNPLTFFSVVAYKSSGWRGSLFRKLIFAFKLFKLSTGVFGLKKPTHFHGTPKTRFSNLVTQRFFSQIKFTQ